MDNRGQGFTFIEMLLAVSLFALVGLASIAVLSSVTKSDELSRESSQRLIEIQRTMLMLERDFMQISARHVRIDGEPAEKNRLVGAQYLFDSEDHGISFSRQGWRNPGMILPRSEIQAVAYRLQEGVLQRLFTLYPDAVTGTVPRIQMLQSDLTGFEVEYLLAETWQQRWQDSNLPTAVKVTLIHTYLGRIERIFMLPDGLVAEQILQ
ncbi:type II secretion system minor pseudopilin GspJ [Rheinheimera salexigens]|uniref:Type II secretion system protein J n=1 Tax=Rheinheimera salexigens TaxID=1628148 RepID=A0A1E7Q1X2_9GAMM|nr:type II secretion system minor pseudopilin GspJ [Rheinheimera salexigens]OEY68195.1 type II secretion system protein GspJ [Rheinheimera salexigens]